MKVESYSLYPITFNLPRPVGDARNPYIGDRGVYLILQLDTDVGAQGYACTTILARPYIADLMEQHVLGKSPCKASSIWRQMQASANGSYLTDPGITPSLALIDIALWDLKAQDAGQPLWQHLGGSTPEIEVYASGLDMGLPDADLIAFYRKQAARGISLGKLKVNSISESNQRRLRLMRDALAESGKEPRLAIDANQTWSPSEAVEQIRELEQAFPLEWIEEPLPFEDFEGMRKLADAVSTPIVSGENLRSYEQFEELVETGISSLIQIMPITLGGFTPTLQVAELVHQRGARLSLINTPGSLAAPLAAALPHCDHIEFIDLGRGEAMGWKPSVKGGRLQLSRQPGLGMRPSQEALTLPQPDRSYRGIEFSFKHGG